MLPKLPRQLRPANGGRPLKNAFESSLNKNRQPSCTPAPPPSGPLVLFGAGKPCTQTRGNCWQNYKMDLRPGAELKIAQCSRAEPVSGTERQNIFFPRRTVLVPGSKQNAGWPSRFEKQARKAPGELNSGSHPLLALTKGWIFALKFSPSTLSQRPRGHPRSCDNPPQDRPEPRSCRHPSCRALCAPTTGSATAHI